jgi:L-lactate permease
VASKGQGDLRLDGLAGDCAVGDAGNSNMGKMIDAQSIVVASTATRWFDHEGDILRFVFFYSIALACLVGILVTLQAYVFPFTVVP